MGVAGGVVGANLITPYAASVGWAALIALIETRILIWKHSHRRPRSPRVKRPL